ncbi:MAG: FeoB-associated Cys-rich membrane protein [Eubacteriales bacterium]|nr:FeoB-associated Cys-rich membrane protein [Eubacteriales bacterium]
MGTVIVGGVLAIIVGLLIWKMIKDKKTGKSSCGGDCAHCKGCGK